MSSTRSLSLLQVGRIPSHSLPSRHLTLRISSPSSHVLRPEYGRRSFHWQSAANTAIDGTQQLLIELHNVTHLPWFLTIPLVAFTVGAVFRLPFTIYSQRILQRRGELGPIMQAWNAKIQQDVQRDRIPSSRIMSEVKSRQDKVWARLYKKLGLQGWRLYGNFLSFPFWLLAIDGVRRLCGGPSGLIGSLIGGARRTTKDAQPATTTMESMVDPSTVDPNDISSAVEIVGNVIIDPGLKFEGCLWFTDLTASDPYHILPVALSASLVFNLWPKSKEQFFDRVRIFMGRRPHSRQAQILAEDERVSWGERGRASLYLMMLGLATLVGPATLHLPAALHLYWLASSASNALFVRTLNHLMPIQGSLRKRCTGVEPPYIRPYRKV
ncbi:hypothetical protein GGR50DRAFT_676809 [Xylaria sp. CBS 124048]|nr:hypothetical protein GGR50DRAFT_676809 [Xylaria sp. CBS 124048]